MKLSAQIAQTQAPRTSSGAERPSENRFRAGPSWTEFVGNLPFSRLNPTPSGVKSGKLIHCSQILSVPICGPLCCTETFISIYIIQYRYNLNLSVVVNALTKTT